MMTVEKIEAIKLHCQNNGAIELGSEQALELCDLAKSALQGWQPMDTAPMNGQAFIAFGIHDTDNGHSWQKGCHWWAILLYDVYREIGMGGSQFVFSKDGTKPWSAPLHWMPLPAPPSNATGS